MKMKNITVHLGMAASLAVALVLAGFSRADMGIFGHTELPFPIEPPNAVPIRLESSDDAKEATLSIPKALLGKAKRTDSDGKQPRTAVWPSALAVSGGLALTLTVSSLGFIRLRIRPGGKSLLLILALAAVLIAGRCSLQADAPNPYPIHFNPSKVSLAGGNVMVKIVDDGDTVRLVVPRSQLADWAARLKASEKNSP